MHSVPPAASTRPSPRPAAIARRIIDVEPQAFGRADGAGRVLTAYVAAAVAICLHDPVGRAGVLGVLLMAGDRADGHRACPRERERADARVARMLDALASKAEERDRLEAHVFGGASLLIENVDPYIGARSASFTLRLLDREGIPVRSTDLGGCFPRRIRFDPAAQAPEAEFLPLKHAPAIRVLERDRLASGAYSAG